MLDKRAFQLLEVIMTMATEGESSVLEKSEMLYQLGEDWDQSDLDASMETLVVNDMITMRYSDDNLYCLTPQPKAKLVFQKRQEKAVLADIIESGVDCIPNAINYKKLAIICGTASFIGAFVAGIIVFILARFSH